MIAEKHDIEHINQVEVDGDLQKSMGSSPHGFQQCSNQRDSPCREEIQRVSLEREVYLYLILHTNIGVSQVPVLQSADAQPIETPCRSTGYVTVLGK